MIERASNTNETNNKNTTNKEKKKEIMLVRDSILHQKSIVS